MLRTRAAADLDQDSGLYQRVDGKTCIQPNQQSPYIMPPATSCSISSRRFQVRYFTYCFGVVGWLGWVWWDWAA